MGQKSKKWFNHTITFNFNTNTVDAGEDQSNSGDNGNNGNNGGPTTMEITAIIVAQVTMAEILITAVPIMTGKEEN